MADDESPFTPLLKETSQTTGLHAGTEGGARVEDAQKGLIKNPSDIDALVQYLDTSLSDAQLQSIQLGCSSALGIPVEQIGGDRASNSFSDLYTAMKRKFTKERVQGVLRFMLERVHYDMTDLEWLPRFNKFLFQEYTEYRKLDMLLSLAYMVTSMTVEDYKRFRDQLIRQDDATDNSERILIHCNVDTLVCRCHLLKLLVDKEQFDTDDIKNVFRRLDKSGCSDYRTEIVEYCNRHKLEVPEPQDHDGGESNTHSTTSCSCLCK